MQDHYYSIKTRTYIFIEHRKIGICSIKRVLHVGNRENKIKELEFVIENTIIFFFIAERIFHQFHL